MNARQKAKKYKRMYEKLLKQPVKIKVEQHRIDTLRFELSYPEELIMQGNSNHLRDIVIRDIAQNIANDLDKYVEYYTVFYPFINEYRFYGEIKVISRK